MNIPKSYDLAQLNTLALYMLGNFFLLLFSSADFFLKILSGTQDPDLDRLFVGTEQSPNCLQGFSADGKSRRSKERVRIPRLAQVLKTIFHH